MIDGVIKYQVEHLNEAAPVCSDYEQLEALRSRLFALGLIGEKDGVGYGNLSLRGEKDKSFFITATQTGKQASLQNDQYTWVCDYDFDAFKVISKGKCKPSSEALSHAMIYEINAEITAVIHVHSKQLWQLMKERKMLATTAEYGTEVMVQEINRLYQDQDPFYQPAFVMLGHEDGIITFGRSLEAAELALYAILRDYLTLNLGEGFLPTCRPISA